MSGHDNSGGPGGYRLRRRIAFGPRSELWVAEAPGGFPCAIKILLDAGAAHEKLAALQLLGGLRHRCLLQVHAFWTHQDRLHIVMELADGSLRDHLSQGQAPGEPGIPPRELLTYFRDAAEGLDYLRSQHVLHLDVKPDRILLFQGGAKVAGLSLARLPERGRSLPVTGAGTPLYMAPEVFRSQVSAPSDQYSLAMAYAELRLGRRVLAGTNLMEIMLEHLQKTPDLAPLPAAEEAVLLRALAKEPEQRYPTCLAFVQALEQTTPGWIAP